jgi:hypothetical protein
MFETSSRHHLAHKHKRAEIITVRIVPPMSRHTVSWTINDSDSCVSPTLSSSSASAVSIVSINSIVSDTHTTGAQPAGFRAKFTYFLAPDDSFVPHDTYFFKDGNITFLVRDAPYCALGSSTRAVGRRHTLLCPSVFLLSGLGLFLHQI